MPQASVPNMALSGIGSAWLARGACAGQAPAPGPVGGKEGPRASSSERASWSPAGAPLSGGWKAATKEDRGCSAPTTARRCDTRRPAPSCNDEGNDARRGTRCCAGAVPNAPPRWRLRAGMGAGVGPGAGEASAGSTAPGAGVSPSTLGDGCCTGGSGGRTASWTSWSSFSHAGGASLCTERRRQAAMQRSARFVEKRRPTHSPRRAPQKRPQGHSSRLHRRHGHLPRKISRRWPP